MLIGIISECIGKKKRFENFLGRKYTLDKISNESNPFDALAVVFPYSVEEIKAMQEKRCERILKKAMLQLLENNVDKIILSNQLREYIPNIRSLCEIDIIADGTQVFYRYIPDLIRKTAEKCSISLMNARVCIRASSADRITRYLINSLCYDTKYISMMTNDLRGARELRDELAEETGLFLNVIRSGDADNPICDILADVENNRVRIGRNVIVDGIEFGFDTQPYMVQSIDIAACLRTEDLTGKLLYYNCGKNKLTL